jgi:acyl-coenzyme A synthetase/AMP-(fatty) acid ligase
MRLERHAVSEILFTPTLFSNFMATTTPSMRAAAASTLRTVHLNGEVVTVDLARRGDHDIYFFFSKCRTAYLTKYNAL